MSHAPHDIHTVIVEGIQVDSRGAWTLPVSALAKIRAALAAFGATEALRDAVWAMLQLALVLEKKGANAVADALKALANETTPRLKAASRNAVEASATRASDRHARFLAMTGGRPRPAVGTAAAPGTMKAKDLRFAPVIR